jgi:large subunit ribosomal protein L6
MSRIGRMPVPLPDGVKVDINDSLVKVTGPKGSISRQIPSEVAVSVADGNVSVSVEPSIKNASALSGLARSLINGMVTGVSKGFEKSLELVGIGYRAELKGNALHLTLGYSHPIQFDLPKGITATIDKQTKITLGGIDKQLLGETAAVIRSFKKPEPYKGKGIKYADEYIRRKIGKKGIK